MLNISTARVNATPASHPIDDEFDTLRDEIIMSECFRRNWASWPRLFARIFPQPWSARAISCRPCVPDKSGVKRDLIQPLLHKLTQG